MTWTISKRLMKDYENSHCSPGQAAASLAGNCWGGEPCAPSKSTLTPEVSWLPDKTTASSTDSPSGTMFAHLTVSRGEGLLTWFLAGFPARTSVPPKREPRELVVPEVDCGEKWRALSVKYDRVSSGWKTHQCLFPEDLEWSSLILPKWGLMHDGELWERDTPGHLTSETDAGYWHTPISSEGNGGGQCGLKRLRGGHTLRLRDQVKTPALFPTPRATDGTKGSRSLAGAQKEILRGRNKDLGMIVALFPTPRARDWKGQTQRGVHAPMDGLGNLDQGDGTPIGGSLNPDWVEWLMGWVPGWTSLSPISLDLLHIWKQAGSAWWDHEPMPRVKRGAPARVHRLKCIGNGQVPLAMVLAWDILTGKECE